MSSETTVCVFLGSRDDVFLARSRLAECGIQARIEEVFGHAIAYDPHVMGGTEIGKILVTPGEADRAKLMLADMHF